jgi:hypothetical protein
MLKKKLNDFWKSKNCFLRTLKKKLNDSWKLKMFALVLDVLA